MSQTGYLAPLLRAVLLGPRVRADPGAERSLPSRSPEAGVRFGYSRTGDSKYGYVERLLVPGADEEDRYGVRSPLHQGSSKVKLTRRFGEGAELRQLHLDLFGVF